MSCPAGIAAVADSLVAHTPEPDYPSTFYPPIAVPYPIIEPRSNLAKWTDPCKVGSRSGARRALSDRPACHLEMIRISCRGKWPLHPSIHLDEAATFNDEITTQAWAALNVLRKLRDPVQWLKGWSEGLPASSVLQSSFDDVLWPARVL